MTEATLQLPLLQVPGEPKAECLVLDVYVHGVPATKGSTKSFFIKKLNRTVTTSANANLKGWESSVGQEVWVGVNNAKHGLGIVFPLEGPIVLVSDFYLPRPKSLPANVLYPTVSRDDLDKLMRGICDPMSEMVYHDDGQIVEAHIFKHFASTENPCGCRIRIGVKDGRR